MRFTTLDAWLNWQESLHPAEIELGLERVETVMQRLHPHPPLFPVITVAGTNGKGSSVAMLESILLTAGYRVGTYTSPHLLSYNERVRLNGQPVNDALLIASFDRVDIAREETSLTYFEFGTLAALDIFYRENLDVVVLEVGLGGRLDAVNVIDPTIALITSISVDHAEWLGDDRESIALEKAGIMRAGRPVIFSGRDMPNSMAQQAREIKAPLAVLERDFHYRKSTTGWQWWSGSESPLLLPYPELQGDHQLDNAAGVLMLLQQLADRLPVSLSAIREGLQQVVLPGRFQVIPNAVTWILDVAHNPEGIGCLAAMLESTRAAGRTLAVIGMMRDKDIRTAIQELQDEVDVWYTTNLTTPRSADSMAMAEVIRQVDETSQVIPCHDVAEACEAAKKAARDGDRILVCGSFYTVAAALAHGI